MRDPVVGEIVPQSASISATTLRSNLADLIRTQAAGPWTPGSLAEPQGTHADVA